MSGDLVPYVAPRDLALPIVAMGAPHVPEEALRKTEEAALEARMSVDRVNALIRFATRQESHNGQHRLR